MFSSFVICVFFFKQKTAYEMRISDWSSDVCSSDLDRPPDPALQMFVCECIDGAQGAGLRKQTGPAHHEYQAGVMDRFVARGPLRSDDGGDLLGSLDRKSVV